MAEKIFADNIKEILYNSCDDFNEEVRPSYADGTKAHSKYITQVFEKYSIENNEFPITSLRPIAWKSGIKEILWIYKDASNDLELLKNKYNVTWWDSWDMGDRSIGQAYGAVVREYKLMENLLKNLKDNPFARRHIMSLWQYVDLGKPHGLDPCAFETIWSVRKKNAKLYLDMTLIQRSSDYLVAGHINKMQYVALMLMVARHCGYEVGNFSHLVQNLHIYDRHFDKAKILLERYENLPKKEKKPILLLNTSKNNFYDFEAEDFELINYTPMEKLEFELAI